MSNRTSALQFEIMMDYFEEYPHLLSGKVDSDFTKEMKEEKWKELAYALNIQGNGPKKNVAGWRKTLKDWKCYVRKKAHRIALEQEETGCIATRDKLSAIEEKLLAAVAGKSIHEPIYEIDEDDEVETDDMDIRDYYSGRKKVKKRKITEATSPDVYERLIRFRNKTKESQRMGKSSEVSERLIRSQNKLKESPRIVHVAEKRPTLLEQEVALLERRTVAAEKKAKAEEKLLLLKEKELHQQWRNQMHTLRMKKLEFL